MRKRRECLVRSWEEREAQGGEQVCRNVALGMRRKKEKVGKAGEMPGQEVD